MPYDHSAEMIPSIGSFPRRSACSAEWNVSTSCFTTIPDDDLLERYALAEKACSLPLSTVSLASLSSFHFSLAQFSLHETELTVTVNRAPRSVCCGHASLTSSTAGCLIFFAFLHQSAVIVPVSFHDFTVRLLIVRILETVTP